MRPLNLHASEDGISLVELLVTLTILLTVITIALSGMMRLGQASDVVQSRSLDGDQARLAVAALSRGVRAAGPPVALPSSETDTAAFRVAQPRQMRFFSRVGLDGSTVRTEGQDQQIPVLLEFRLAPAGQITETVTRGTVAADGTVTYPTANAVTRVVAQDVRSTVARPLFEYGIAQADGTTTWVATPNQAQRRQINVVRIAVSVAADTGSGTPQELETLVRLPNNITTSEAVTS